MVLYNYKVPVIIKKKTSHSVLVNIFQDFPGLTNKIQELSRAGKNPGLFQDVTTLSIRARTGTKRYTALFKILHVNSKK